MDKLNVISSLTTMTDDNQTHHIRKKRLLDSLKELPELNQNDCNVSTPQLKTDSINKPTGKLECIEKCDIRMEYETLKVEHENLSTKMLQINSSNHEDEVQNNLSIMENTENPKISSNIFLDETAQHLLQILKASRNRIGLLYETMSNSKEVHQKNFKNTFQREITTLKNITIESIRKIIATDREKLAILHIEINEFEDLIQNSSLENLEMFLRRLEALEGDKSKTTYTVRIIRELKEFKRELEDIEQLLEKGDMDENEVPDSEQLHTAVKCNDLKFYQLQTIKCQRQQTDETLVNNYTLNSTMNGIQHLTPNSQVEQSKKPYEKIPSDSAKVRYQIKMNNKFQADENGMVCIGPNGTLIAKTALEAIKWSLSGPAVTRKILVEVFGLRTLESHNLSGKESPAFIGCNKPRKKQLDPSKVEDIIHFMKEQKDLSDKDVRRAIITKCADVNKKYRKKDKKK